MDGGFQHCTGDSNQNYPQEKGKQEGKVVDWEGLTNSSEKKWKAKEKGKDIPNCWGSLECRLEENFQTQHVSEKSEFIKNKKQR